MIKIELQVGGILHDITDNVSNWEDIEITFKRQSYTGVIRSFADKFKFIGYAFDLLLNEYLSNYLNSSAVVIVSEKNRIFEYDEVFRCDLDFVTFENDGFTISMNAIDNSIANIIKSNKSQVYDIPVSEIKQDNYLEYDRLVLRNNMVSTFVISDYTIQPEDGLNTVLSVNADKLEHDLPLEEFYSGEVYNTTNVSIDDSKRIYYKKDVKLSISCEFDITNNTQYGTIYFGLRQDKGFYGIPAIVLRKFLIQNGQTVHIIIDNLLIDTSSGDGYVSFYAQTTYELPTFINLFKAKFTISNFNGINSIYYSRGETVNIDSITPSSLLNRLINNMIFNKLDSLQKLPIINFPSLNTCILAAESIRGIKDAKIHTSFSKFTEWMEATFGYTYYIDDNVINFIHRDSLFNNTVTDIIEEANNLTLSANSSLVYTGVEVGYEQQDYESINGKYEFRFTNSYSTGITGNDNILKLISPYRPDAYGIEFLVIRRGQDSNDNKSDNDIFFVNASPIIDAMGRNKWVLDRSIPITGMIDNASMFNVIYSPRNILLNNINYIACCTNKLKFTASQGNSDITIGGIPEKMDINILESNRLFRIEDLQFETKGGINPQNLNGLIQVELNGYRYKGYINEISNKIGRNKTTMYKLICKNIDKL